MLCWPAQSWRMQSLFEHAFHLFLAWKQPKRPPLPRDETVHRHDQIVRHVLHYLVYTAPGSEAAQTTYLLSPTSACSTIALAKRVPSEIINTNIDRRPIWVVTQAWRWVGRCIRGTETDLLRSKDGNLEPCTSHDRYMHHTVASPCFRSPSPQGGVSASSFPLTPFDLLDTPSLCAVAEIQPLRVSAPSNGFCFFLVAAASSPCCNPQKPEHAVARVRGIRPRDVSVR
mmetsp:Transcript_25621/g.47779  ORF Transcript_25621/g.47779 Transcript_25621/m.47779 type:complete len:228 (-) Transcript_25621:198-881(-)